MFGKLVIEVDKASIIAAIAFVGASFSCLIISKGITTLIHGTGDDRWARVKGLLMLASGLCLLAINLVAVLRSDIVIKRLTQHLEYLSI